MSLMHVEYTVRDADNDAAPINILFGYDTDILVSALPGILDGIWQTIKPLTTGRLSNVSVRLVTITQLDSFFDPSNVADVLADANEKALFKSGGGGFFNVLSIPCFKETLFVNGGAGKEVDISAPDVAAFISLLLDGYPLGGGHFLQQVSIGGQICTELKGDPVQSFVKRVRRKLHGQ